MKKFSKFISSLIAISAVLCTSVTQVSASTDTTRTYTPYGTMTGYTWVANDYFGSNTLCTNSAPVISVYATIQNAVTGTTLDNDSSVGYNCSSIGVGWHLCYDTSNITIFGAHEV